MKVVVYKLPKFLNYNFHNAYSFQHYESCSLQIAEIFIRNSEVYFKNRLKSTAEDLCLRSFTVPVRLFYQFLPDACPLQILYQAMYPLS